MSSTLAVLAGAFVLWVLLIPVFAWRYASLHRVGQQLGDPQFLFAKHYTKARLRRLRSRHDQRVVSLRARRAAIRALAADLESGTAAPYLGPHGFHVTSPFGVKLRGFEDYTGPEPRSAPPLLIVELDGKGHLQRATYEHPSPQTITPLLDYLNHFLSETSQALSHEAASVPRRTAVPWRFADFLYFSTMTQATAGYGDILPNSTRVRLLTVLQVLVSYAIVLVVVNLLLAGASSWH